MKKRIVFIFLLFTGFTSFAAHISGGEMYYKYLGPGAGLNTNKYEITLRLFRDCSASGVNVSPMPSFVIISIFDNTNDNRISNNTVNRNISLDQRLQKNDYSCLDTRPEVCYDVGYYTFQVDLPINSKGYTTSFQTCCRVGGITNILNNFNSTNGSPGVTYAARISGSDELGSTGTNSSPQFKLKDTALVCAGNFFTLDFSATDTDGTRGDSLSYSFCSAYGSSPNVVDANPNLAGGGPINGDFYFLDYNIGLGYTGSAPMGANISINPVTGIISGLAPATPGRFVINVCITEWRNGKSIGRHRKDFNIKTASCNPLSAALNPQYSVCNSYFYSFSNNSSNPSGTTYLWEFGDPNSGSQNTSTSANPSHTYSDTGSFKLKLTVTLNGQCTNTDSSIVKVYPLLSSEFTSTGQCKNTTIQFNDKTQTTYGTVNSWSWNFGDPTSGNGNNTSTLQNPTHNFATAGNYTVTLTTENTKGCINTISKTIEIKNQPDLTVTNDTLICSIDTLQLNAAGSGTFQWTPNYNINNQSNASPLVSPDVPTKYYVTLTDPFGCKAFDSVFVDVKLFVSIDAGKDTGICAGDNIQLSPVSDALHYQWSPAGSLNDPLSKSPTASPSVTTKYYVIGNIGKCQSFDSVIVRVAPYPGAAGIPDTVLCFGDSIQFNATGGSQYTWSPAFYLSNANIPNPVANPDKSIRYIVTIRDTLGCLKPVFDTILLQVERVTANAGPRDTSIVLNQALQLNGTGGDYYLWSPPTGLNNPTIANPVATLNNDMDYVLWVTTASGCYATDTISIKVFKVLPGIYVPTAFTPNSDGHNDVFKPIPIGIKSITRFKVFNRWGVLMYSSDSSFYEQPIGWDGNFKGRPQDSGVYVWLVEGIDYLDKKITQKGSVTLIR